MQERHRLVGCLPGNKRLPTNLIAYVLSGCLFLPGCASKPPPIEWSKPGGSIEQLHADRYVCLQQSQQSVSYGSADAYGAHTDSRVITNQTLFGACMQARGYEGRIAQK